MLIDDACGQAGAWCSEHIVGALSSQWSVRSIANTVLVSAISTKRDTQDIKAQEDRERTQRLIDTGGTHRDIDEIRRG